MQAYAYLESHPRQHRIPAQRPAEPARNAGNAPSTDPDLIDQLLGRLADLVIDRLINRAEADGNDRVAQWLDVRGAADYLGIHPDTLRKLAAQRSIPTHQDGPRCKLYFRRDELDEWRLASKPAHRRTPRLRAV
jgi:excisionase family DNA binding protein